MKWKIECIEKITSIEWVADDEIEVKFRHPFTDNVLTEPVYLIKGIDEDDRQIVQYQNGMIEYWVNDANVND